jgi:hypothetical protein
MTQTAIERHVELMIEISQKLHMITVAHNMRYDSMDMDWGTVGDLSRINDLLAEVVELSK